MPGTYTQSALTSASSPLHQFQHAPKPRDVFFMFTYLEQFYANVITPITLYKVYSDLISTEWDKQPIKALHAGACKKTVKRQKVNTTRRM